MSIGELCGLHTLSSILSALHIKSNQYHKLWKGFTVSQIRQTVEAYCLEEFSQRIVSIASKSAATWSRSELTIVIDDSIFKQWLKNMPKGEHFDKYYSGQTHCTVYGFRVNLLGVAIGNDFYPLYFKVVPKGESTKQAALELLKKVYALLQQIGDKHNFKYPNLYLSVDSGFTCPKLIAYCQKNNIGFIGVPKKTNKVQIGRYDLNIKGYIDKVYLKKEKAYLADCEQKGEKPKPFLLRKKAYYQALDQVVILVFFRLNGSNRVSVIYSTKMNDSAKTLRRRFFQRTKIELFFRLLKDTLKIQKSKSVDLPSFTKKLNLFIFKGMVCLKFERFCRRKIRSLRKWAFTKLRHHLIYEDLVLAILENLTKTRGFCMKPILERLDL